jgi:GT2 family glycosyltransferase
MPVASSPRMKPTRTAPLLSVVMPVYNALPHLDEAIESILGQGLGEFEFLILNDASTDGSAERLSHWACRDARIRLLHSDTNLGPVHSSNLVARAAAADLVARMDADDISDPDRLAKQVEVFDSHPSAAVVGSLCDIIDEKGRTLRTAEAWRLSRRAAFVPFAHGAMMYRRSVFDAIGGYREECAYWEDQDLVVRMAQAGDVLVIPRSLYKVRAWTSSTRLSSDSKVLEQAINRMYAAADRVAANPLAPTDERTSRSGKVDPRVFISLGSVVLWAGGKPRLFRRLLKDGKLGYNFRTAAALVWAAWASLSPSTLRLFLQLLLVARNLIPATMIRSDEPVVWKPGSGAIIHA